MKYLYLCDLYEKLENTSKRLEKTFYLADFINKIPFDEIEDVFLLIEGKAFVEDNEQKMGVSDSTVVKAIKVSTGADEKRINDLWKKEGDLGSVAQELTKSKSQATLFQKELTVSKIVKNLQKISGLEGLGVVNQKVQLISELLTSAKAKEARYLVRMILQSLRVGISSGTIRDAIGWNFLAPVDDILFVCKNCKRVNSSVEQCMGCGNELLKEDSKGNISKEDYDRTLERIDQAYNILNDFGTLVKKLKEKGIEGLADIKPVVGKAMKVMLFQKVKSVSEAFERVGKPAAVEYKYDGFRILVHKNNDNIRIFTRNLEDVTVQFPEIIEYAKSHVKSDNIIIDSEAVGFDKKTGEYLPFQKISQRIKRKYDIDDIQKTIGVEWTVFDVLFCDDSLLDEPFEKRRNILEENIRAESKRVVPSKIIYTEDEEKAAQFYHDALDDKQEGVMFKNLKARYRPGARVGYGVKLKPVMDPLDLVITGAEWGEGKRASWLTSFTVSCISGGEFLEVGKVGTGFKEIEGSGVDFKTLTEQLRPLIKKEQGLKVQIKPKIIIEVAFEEIQKSVNYGSGYALRFPRVLRLRPEKPTDEISTLSDVKGYYNEQF